MNNYFAHMRAAHVFLLVYIKRVTMSISNKWRKPCKNSICNNCMAANRIQSSSLLSSCHSHKSHIDYKIAEPIDSKSPNQWRGVPRIGNGELTEFVLEVLAVPVSWRRGGPSNASSTETPLFQGRYLRLARRSRFEAWRKTEHHETGQPSQPQPPTRTRPRSGNRDLRRALRDTTCPSSSASSVAVPDGSEGADPGGAVARGRKGRRERAQSRASSLRVISRRSPLPSGLWWIHHSCTSNSQSHTLQQVFCLVIRARANDTDCGSRIRTRLRGIGPALGVALHRWSPLAHRRTSWYGWIGLMLHCWQQQGIVSVLVHWPDTTSPFLPDTY